MRSAQRYCREQFVRQETFRLEADQKCGGSAKRSQDRFADHSSQMVQVLALRVLALRVLALRASIGFGLGLGLGLGLGDSNNLFSVGL